MDILNFMLRAGSLSVILLIGILLTRDLKSIPTKLCAGLFLYGVGCYLLDPIVRVHWDTPFARTIVFSGAFHAPMFFWLFAQTLFNDSFRMTRIPVAIIVAYLLLGISLDVGDILPFEIVPESARESVFSLRHIWALAFIGHGLIVTGIGKDDDLLEPRRRLRALMIWSIGAYISLVLLTEVVISDSVRDSMEFAHPINTLNMLGILALTLIVGASLTKTNAAFAGPAKSNSQKSNESHHPVRNPADTLAIAELLEFIEKEKGFTTEGLTIVRLAEQLSLPEHRLRKLINSELGFRNFSDFLNRYRIEAACQDLADPAKARIPILTLAMDLGYQSIGPFNRAFKEKMGVTPSEFRKSSFAQAEANAAANPTANSPLPVEKE